MKTLRCIFTILLAVTWMSSCLQPNLKSVSKKLTPWHQKKLVKQYLSEAQAMEAEGDLVGANERYKLVLTVDPENETALAKTDQLSATLRDLADQHFQTGKQLFLKGDYTRARQEWLTALRYDPEHAEAQSMLTDHKQKLEQAKGYVSHTIQPGESISMLAHKYYGDYRQFHLIAEYNQMEDATRIAPGQVVKVPIIEGMTFFAQPGATVHEPDGAAVAQPAEVMAVKSYLLHTVQAGESLSILARDYYGDYKKFDIIAQYNQLDPNVGLNVGQQVRIPEIEGLPLISQTPQTSTATARVADEPVPAVTVKPKSPPAVAAPPPDDQSAHYRELGIELYQSQNYAAAILEFKKVLNVNPKDPIAYDYLTRAHTAQGKRFFDNARYAQAIEAFETAQKYDPDCSDCRVYIDQSRAALSDQSRSKAIALFNAQEYAQAIVEFKQLISRAPQDVTAKDYLSKAYFQQGMLLFGKEQYLPARDAFNAALETNATCQQCDEYRLKSEEIYKETHYNRGVVHYGAEELEAAITEWERVYALDPQYKDVTPNLKKARVLWERLESIKRSRTKGQGAQ
jgi:tetratricopeptide (TPR) repeat protein